MPLFGTRNHNNSDGKATMISEVEIPTRSRLWSAEDARAAYNLLVEGKAAKFGSYTAEEYPDVDRELKARSQGGALNTLIGENHNQRFGITVWTDENGTVIGALIPRAPKKMPPRKGQGKAAAKSNGK